MIAPSSVYDVADVRIWWLDLDAPGAEIERCEAVLDGEERARAANFYFPRDARRFTVGRAALRMALAELLGTTPEKVAFKYGSYGKPELDPRHETALTFNVSHSGGVGVIAVTTGRQLGVDVERVRSLRDMDSLARRVFSARELATLDALPAELRVTAFFRCWTRKEAYIKATGAGLAQPLDAFSVSLEPDAPACILEIGGAAEAAQGWTLLDLEAPPGFAAALVCEGAARTLSIAPFHMDTP